MIEYFFPLLLLCVIQSGTPGPNNIMLTASGRNFGYFGSIPHMAGVVFGFLSLLIVLSLGLITIFNNFPFIQTLLQILGSLYLLYLSSFSDKSLDINRYFNALLYIPFV